MKVPHASIRKVGFSPKELSDGSYRVSGSFTLRGTLDKKLAKVLEVEPLEKLDKVGEFQVSREAETVAIEFVSLSGNEVLCSVAAASLHKWKVTRVAGELLITLEGSTDHEGAHFMADFLGRHPSWAGSVTIEPAQRELFAAA